MNSIGSVIPVKNEVSAAAPITEAATCLFSFLAAITIAAPAAGSPKIMNGNLPCRYEPGLTPSVILTCVNIVAPNLGSVNENAPPPTLSIAVHPPAAAFLADSNNMLCEFM